MADSVGSVMMILHTYQANMSVSPIKCWRRHIIVAMDCLSAAKCNIIP